MSSEAGLSGHRRHQEAGPMKHHHAGVFAVMIALPSLGCVVRAPAPPPPVVVAPAPPPPIAIAPRPPVPVYVESIPPLPPPRPEVIVVQPGPAHVWVAGHWAWRPASRAYVWIPGVWVV